MYSDETTDPYAFGEDAREEYENAGSRLLLVPEGARTLRNGSHVWTELVQIVDVEFREGEKALKNPEEKGDVCFALNFTFDVDPTSQVDGVPTRNPGKRFYTTCRYNLSAWKREKAKGGSFAKGHANMTQRANILVKSFLNALGMSLDLGLSPKRLVDEKEAFIGQKVWAKIQQSGKGADFESVEATGFISEEA